MYYTSCRPILQTAAELQNKLDARQLFAEMARGLEIVTPQVTPIVPAKMPEASPVSNVALVIEHPAIKHDTDFVVAEPSVGAVLVPERTVCNYFATSMHLAEPYRNEELFERLENAKIKIPVAHPQVGKSDGQLKILVDFAIGIDHYVSREGFADLRVLVVGSTSESGRASMSYRIMDYVDYACNITIDLYDPYETDREVRVERGKNYTHYRYHRAYFKYDKHNIQHDLLFDDAYVVTGDIQTRHRHIIDPDGVFAHYKDYSVKCLLADYEFFQRYGGIKYSQCLRTDSGEVRMTKYPRLYGPYTANTLGRCAACAELVYMWRQKYSRRVTDYVLTVHKAPCERNIPRAKKAYVSQLVTCCPFKGQVITTGSRVSCCEECGAVVPLYLAKPALTEPWRETLMDEVVTLRSVVCFPVHVSEMLGVRMGSFGPILPQLIAKMPQFILEVTFADRTYQLTPFLKLAISKTQYPYDMLIIPKPIAVQTVVRDGVRS